VKISLIYPLLSRSRSLVDENKQYWPPLGLAYIAAVLRKNGHAVQILDRDLILRKNKLDFNKTDAIVLELINNFGTQITGFSATTPNVSDVNTFSRKVKKLDKNIITVIGGPHCAGEPVATLEICSGIDMLVRGEGEAAMLDIANGMPIESIGGLTYRKVDGSIVSNPDRQLIESLDSLPLPARDLLDMDYYTRPSRFISRNLSFRATHIFTARGCPYNCHYCAGPLIGQHRVRYHSAQRVISEIEELINKYSIEAIYFAEDMFLSSKKRAQEMVTMFIEHDIHKKIVWMAQISPAVVDSDLLSIMKKAGCVHVEYGFESGSQRILDLMNKRTNVERNKEVALLTKKSGLRFQGNFIVGYPQETEEDFGKTVFFIKQTRPNNIALNLFMPLPGTEIYKKLKQEGKLFSGWDDIGNPEAPQINYADMPSSHFEKLYIDTKLKVILPLNLLEFIKDNIRHPLRLFYVCVTQFKGVITKSIKELGRLRKMEKGIGSPLNVLFITYQAVSCPVMVSQGLAYIRGLSKKEIKYSILSFETEESMKNSQAYISGLPMPPTWRHLNYHRKPRLPATLFDIISGIFSASLMIKQKKIKIIHARGFIAALISIFPAKLFGAKLFFDTRGLLADKYVCGGLLKKDSLVYKLIRWTEDQLIRKSDYFTVETYKHAEVIRDSHLNISSKMEVVPCCVDMHRFDYRTYAAGSNNGSNLIYMGKVGTWYLLDEMLDFFNMLSSAIPGSHFTILSETEAPYCYSAVKKKKIDESKITVKMAEAKEVPGILAGAKAGIFFINSYKQYSFCPIKFAEYLACGLPVITNTGIRDCEDIILKEKVGVVINNFSRKEYERAISELKDLLGEGEVLRRRCRAAAERYFSLVIGVEKYQNIYNKLIDNNLNQR